MVSGMGIALLAAVMVLVAVIVLAAWRAPKRTAVVVAGFGVAAVIALLLLRFDFAGPHASHPVRLPPEAKFLANNTPATPASGSDSDFAYSASSIWLDGIEEQFEADVYPSLDSAGRALGRRLATLLKPQLKDNPKSTIIQLSSFDEPQRDEMSIEVGKVLRSNLDDVEVLRMDEAAMAPLSQFAATDQYAVSVRLEFPNWQFGSSDSDSDLPDVMRGEARATATGPFGELQCDARFANAPWLADFGRFAARHDARNWLVGRSSRFSTTLADAKGQAIRDAAEHMAPLLGAAIDRGPGRATAGASWRHRTDLRVEHLSRAMHNGRFVADKFIQRLERPYGAVWRCAVLVDGSSQAIQPLADQVSGIERNRRVSLIRSAASIAGMFAVICVLYFFLNIATRGYYVWSLRAVMILMGAAGLLLLLMVS